MVRCGPGLFGLWTFAGLAGWVRLWEGGWLDLGMGIYLSLMASSENVIVEKRAAIKRGNREWQ